ncbi:MAG: hypothetical protein DIU82_09060 [Bacillota bacterium]|nr:MAG: hypothetical protein DIU82_09060 [Bacillota bacterium]
MPPAAFRLRAPKDGRMRSSAAIAPGPAASLANGPGACHHKGMGTRADSRNRVETRDRTAGRSDADRAALADYILGLLEQSGHRVTEPRVQLIQAVVAWERQAFTGEDLYAELRPTGLGRATVFRTLRLLQELGVLTRLHLADGCQRYVVTPPASGHSPEHMDRLICRQCGRVAYLDECPMEGSLARIAQATGYRVDGHHLDIVGLCAECSAAS